MLLFIFIREEYLTEEANFNTSHVTVYQKDWTAKVADSTISIYLMLLFISLPQTKRLIRDVFQYISCYCLSKKQIAISAKEMDFNTSHVTVYRYGKRCPAIVFDDFNTSHVTVYRRMFHFPNISIVFQYISCYCLSVSRLPRQRFICHFNTSHVTVYLTS